MQDEWQPAESYTQGAHRATPVGAQMGAEAQAHSLVQPEPRLAEEERAFETGQALLAEEQQRLAQTAAKTEKQRCKKQKQKAKRQQRQQPQQPQQQQLLQQQEQKLLQQLHEQQQEQQEQTPQQQQEQQQKQQQEQQQEQQQQESVSHAYQQDASQTGTGDVSSKAAGGQQPLEPAGMGLGPSAAHAEDLADLPVASTASAVSERGDEWLHQLLCCPITKVTGDQGHLMNLSFCFHHWTQCLHLLPVMSCEFQVHFPKGTTALCAVLRRANRSIKVICQDVL